MKLREEMPELDGATRWLNSRAINKKELIGEHPTLIHFWSISCDLCKKAMPEVNEFRTQYKNKLNVIAVHVPRSEEDDHLDDVISTAKTHHITQPIYIDHEQYLIKAFKNKYVPSYYLFDKKGLLRHKQAGKSAMMLLRKRINRLLS